MFGDMFMRPAYIDDQMDNIIRSEERDILDFRVKYELIKNVKSGRDSFDFRAIKESNLILNSEELSVVKDFEWREKEAEKIFSIIVEGEVTPAVLEQVILELI